MPRKAATAYETENSIFAQRLTEIMRERGENQTTLAAKITSQFVTIQRQTISLYMNGQSRPDTERLTAISKVLGVSADWLLGLSHFRQIEPVSQFPEVNKMIFEYSAALDALAAKASQKGVYDILFCNPIHGLFSEFIPASWFSTVSRCQWVLDRIEVFQDESGVYNGNEIIRAFGKETKNVPGADTPGTVKG